MTNLTAYTAATVHLAAAVVRHVATGLDLIADTVHPEIVMHITEGTWRRVWCSTCHASHAAVTMYAHNGDPTDARPIGEYVDCDQEDDDE